MKPEKIKIVYLYAEIMSYNVAVFREYVQNHNAEVHVICWDSQKKTPYKAPEMEGVFYYGKSSFSEQSIVEFVINIKPQLIVTSGWMDKFYINACKKLRGLNIPILAVSDTQFYGTIRQRLGIFYFKMFYKKAFTHLWVAGPFQYEYAKRLGYKNSEIVFNFLSADLPLFNAIYNNTISEKKQKYPHQFLFAGRFAPEKGLDILVAAWNKIENKKDWKLTLVGNGPLKEKLPIQNDIQIIDFVQPEAFEDLIRNSGCFVLPSKKEPWALVLHEFSAAGMPIIASDACGASPYFLINNYNGFTFENENVQDLKEKMENIIHSSDAELSQMSLFSNELGQRITPEIVAKNSLSVIR